MTTTIETTIEAQLTALQAQMDLLMQANKRPHSPTKRLEEIRRNYREQYFGSWEEMRKGETQYGPSGKSYSDYDTIMQIISKTSGLLFKYSRGQASRSASLSELVKTDEDMKDYEVICEAACKSLMDGIKHFSAAKAD